jgi:hypothetical protein
MFNIVGLVLLGSIVFCLGLIVKWEFKRAKRGPRFIPKVLQAKVDRDQEGTGGVYGPPGGARRAFEQGRRRT